MYYYTPDHFLCRSEYTLLFTIPGMYHFRLLYLLSDPPSVLGGPLRYRYRTRVGGRPEDEKVGTEPTEEKVLRKDLRGF